MGLPENVNFARNFAVMVRVQGPDPKGLKMRKHAFHQYHSGKTTLSASGMLLPDTLYDSAIAKHLLGERDRSPVLVVTVASIIEPFLAQQQKESISQGRPELITGVQIDIMSEDNMRLEKDSQDFDEGAPPWHAMQLLKLIDVPASSLVLQSLIEASVGSLEHGWEVGWSLASQNNAPQSFVDVIQSQVHMAEADSLSHMSKSTTRIAVLGASLFSKDVPNINISPSNKRGDFLLAVGSPFGVLSPLHFFNSISVGSIANCYPSSSLLMADIRCLPGTEGGPVFGEQAQLIGILIRPLRQKITGAEIQLVIPWEAIASACSDLLQKEPNAEKGIYYDKEKLTAVGKGFLPKSIGPNGPDTSNHNHLTSFCSSPLPVEKAMVSICLITIDDGIWASGVLLNNEGLLLTNAHLLEPWRFGKRAENDGRYGTNTEINSFPYEESTSLEKKRIGKREKSQVLPKTVQTAVSFVGNKLSSSYRGLRNIRVRLDHMDPWIWCNARVVYVCKGPLDVALLQLEYVPEQLSPIMVDLACPPLGSKAHVIGHGLFGPRCGLFPSVCSGVVAKVVKAKIPFSYQLGKVGSTQEHLPVMLETTAAVHPGGSGGAVVNLNGHMIGLVTSNARHGGGTVIPHLNFSIPCSALLPIFMFSKDMQDLSLLQVLDQTNKHLSSVWALMPPLSPKPPPLPNLPQALLEDENRDGKGSRFAKFIAERQKFTKPVQLSKAAKQFNEILRSKL
ncbi:glyoxysomal processing protease, glyoxysomal isoform X1 [Ziziphus jujuba]|uniref:Glyoxysomal processing protease, glyoxysomal isoform X1 n=2 Tax=Ziziphus jujuba TaxID=326968 RepID=A0A6P4A5P7_ZIZJJ|nr:glyoxysomal processing protease, glyoxysomal isoform X1 [Ziziphus jujuba]